MIDLKFDSEIFLFLHKSCSQDSLTAIFLSQEQYQTKTGII